MNISKHISYEEATMSPTALRLGIKNEPTEAEITSMRLVAEFCFEPLRKWYNKPIKISSFFRCKELNEAIKGSKTSQHCLGEAIDITTGSKSENKKLFEWCKDNLDFDQLINEYDFSWLHISYRRHNNRKQVLVIK